jgi:hypothetical protein
MRQEGIGQPYRRTACFEQATYAPLHPMMQLRFPLR